MSTFMTSLYTVPFDSSLELKEEFSLYLKEWLRSTVAYIVTSKRKVEEINEEYIFWTDNLPNDIVKGKKDSNLLYLSTQEEIPEEMEEERELINNLRKVSPEDPEGLEIKLQLDEIINVVENTLRLFSITILDQVQYYWGIPPETWFQEYPLLIEDVMRAVDFGTENNAPLNMYYPIFNAFRGNLKGFYSMFMSARKEEEDADNTEL